MKLLALMLQEPLMNWSKPSFSVKPAAELPLPSPAPAVKLITPPGKFTKEPLALPLGLVFTTEIPELVKDMPPALVSAASTLKLAECVPTTSPPLCTISHSLEVLT